ncbi:hypothetical protein ACFYN0_35195 [Streptomyces sp. NPDC006704]|uniref:hypothetical protein n=1 Tax=Streptomyces sp. NPDC006704 TaxID=3364760 RepID=UPI0036BF5429
MANVRGHYRKNGSYVRPHTRRTKGPCASPRAVVPRPRPAGATTNVRGHYRKNGSYVRPHTRRMGGPAVVAAASGGGLLLLIVVLIALFDGGSEVPAGTSPSPATSAGAPR